MEQSCSVTSVTGVNDLYLVFTGPVNVDYFVYFRWRQLPPDHKNPGSLGDLNDDGSIDSLDLSLIKRHVLRKTQLTGSTLTNADVNSDGSVDSIDIFIAQKICTAKLLSSGSNANN